jgi:3,4-dihydroxy 2-butanone 4-phosphate synthase
MFSGLISEIGQVIVPAGQSGTDDLIVAAARTAAGLAKGASFAVNGVRLTAADITSGLIRAQTSQETRHRSTLGELAEGARVNVELPIALGDRVNGHLVQGHVDAVGKVTGLSAEPCGRRIWIRPPARTLAELVAKGSVAVDGVSLTVAEIVRDRFSVVLVPGTMAATTLADLAQGHRVNLETDLLAKVARRHHDRPAAALSAAVGWLPWAGHLSGRTGVEKVIAQLAAGGGVVVWDPDREGEGDVVFAGASLKPASVVFLLTQACAHPTVPCDQPRLDRLEIPPMAGEGDRHGTAMYTPVDLAAGTGTGVSAAERAATIRRLAAAEARPRDFLRPGHVFPLAARPGGFAERAGHTEAAIELCRAAGLPTVAAICEVMNPDGTMAGAAELESFTLRWGLPLVEIADLRAWL